MLILELGGVSSSWGSSAKDMMRNDMQTLGEWLDNNYITINKQKDKCGATLFCCLSSCPGKCLLKVERGRKILEIALEIALLAVGEVASSMSTSLPTIS